MRMWLSILLMPFLAQASEMVLVKGGNYIPLFGKGDPISVSSFWVDETAVTNQDFSGFVKKNSNWSKGKAPTLFVDSDYLKHWSASSEVAEKALRQSPVVHVSWFAAKATAKTKENDFQK